MGYDFILKTPPAICIGGGILAYLLGHQAFGIFLVILGAFLQVLWLIMPLIKKYLK